jgi:hypothetical protein
MSGGWKSVFSGSDRAAKIDKAEKKALGVKKPKPKPPAKKKSVKKTVNDNFWGE